MTERYRDETDFRKFTKEEVTVKDGLEIVYNSMVVKAYKMDVWRDSENKIARVEILEFATGGS